MYKDFIKELGNHELYGILSLLIFIVIFLIVLILVFTMKKDKINKLKNLPFEDDDEDPSAMNRENGNHTGAIDSGTSDNNHSLKFQTTKITAQQC